MKTVTTIKEMKLISAEARGEGLTVVLVPTMGFLHDGHIELLNRGREEGHFLVMSLFVNPTQFGENEDLDTYPADIEGDLEKAKSAGVDVVFMPNKDEMYPEGFQTYVEVDDLPDYLCGTNRPGHFRGVATVVTKLFNIVRPHKAVFGTKDFQQLAIIKKMIEDSSINVKIIEAETVREEDGLAMSSRNSYLSKAEREAAAVIPRALNEAKNAIELGEKNSKKIIKKLIKNIEAESMAVVEYVNICDPRSLIDVKKIEDTVLVAVAVKIGSTRLIDNCVTEKLLNLKKAIWPWK